MENKLIEDFKKLINDHDCDLTSEEYELAWKIYNAFEDLTAKWNDITACGNRYFELQEEEFDEYIRSQKWENEGGLAK